MTCFVVAFLLGYFADINYVALLIDVVETFGYTTFELIMWVVIFALASETNINFSASYGFGRGFMQAGIAIGTMAILTMNHLSIASHCYIPAFQIIIVLILLMMVGLLSERNVSESWGC